MGASVQVHGRERKHLAIRRLKQAAHILSVMCRLESADYEGHSLGVLKRVATALDNRVQIRFVPIRRLRTAEPRSLVPQAHDRVQIRGAGGRIVAEEQAYSH